MRKTCFFVYKLLPMSIYADDELQKKIVRIAYFLFFLDDDRSKSFIIILGFQYLILFESHRFENKVDNQIYHDRFFDISQGNFYIKSNPVG